MVVLRRTFASAAVFIFGFLQIGFSQADIKSQGNSAAHAKQIPVQQAPLSYVKLSNEPRISLPYPDTTPTFLKRCDQEGNVYSWMLGSNGLEIVGFTRDGIKEFSASAITDIPEASINRFFPTDSGIEVLVNGIENVKKKTVTERIAGTDEKVQRVKKEGERVYYIARFSKDGSYKSAVKLEIPRFQPYQIGAFQSGNYLVAGVEDDNVPRLYMVNSSGQPIKVLELPGDINEKSKSLRNVLGPGSESTSIGVAAMFANLTGYRDKLLFVRSGLSPIVYEIRDSGEIRATKLHMPSGYNIDTLLSSNQNWMVEAHKSAMVQVAKPESAEDEEEEKIERTLFEIDPNSGEVLRQFVLRGAKREVGIPELSLSCWREDQFIGLRQGHGRVTLVRGDAEVRP